MIKHAAVKINKTNKVAKSFNDDKLFLMEKLNMSEKQMKAFYRLLSNIHVNEENIALILGAFSVDSMKDYNKQFEAIILSLWATDAIYKRGVRNQLSEIFDIPFSVIDKLVLTYVKDFEKVKYDSNKIREIKAELFRGSKFTFQFNNCAVSIFNK